MDFLELFLIALGISLIGLLVWRLFFCEDEDTNDGDDDDTPSGGMSPTTAALLTTATAVHHHNPVTRFGGFFHMYTKSTCTQNSIS